MFKVHLQEVVFNDIFFELRIFLPQIGNALEINLHHFRLAFFREKILREHTHAWPHFEDGDVWAGVNRVGDGLGHVLVFQKMLSEKLLRTYGFQCHKYFLSGKPSGGRLAAFKKHTDCQARSKGSFRQFRDKSQDRDLPTPFAELFLVIFLPLLKPCLLFYHELFATSSALH